MDINKGGTIMTPLEALENIKSLFVGSPIDLSQQFDIIEKELNDNHFYKHMISKVCDFMGLDIIPFEDLVETENAMINYICENECFRVEAATNKNKLKALEIIKEHGVDIAEIIICQDYHQYEVRFCENIKGRVKLNKKEFDFLKEAFE